MPELTPDREEMVQTLKDLLSIAAVTGFEDNIRTRIKELATAHATTAEDNMGNLIAFKEGAPDGLKVILCTHMDEIGFIIRSIDPRGFLYLYPLGGMPDSIGPGLRITVHTERGPVPGTTGIHSPHLPVAGLPPLFADVGAERRHQAMAMGIRVGDPVTVEYSFRRLNQERVMGRCLDNRIGCTVALTLLKLFSRRKLNINLFFVFSATEEHGMHPGNPPAQVHGARGAFIPAMEIKPHFAVVLDSMIANDIPGLPETEQLIRLGRGVALRLVDDMHIMRPVIRNLARSVADKNNINIQESISRSYTDTSAIQYSGAAVCTLGIPVRYIHSPGQIASLSDMESANRLIAAIIELLDETPPDWIAERTGKF